MLRRPRKRRRESTTNIYNILTKRYLSRRKVIVSHSRCCLKYSTCNVANWLINLCKERYILNNNYFTKRMQCAFYMRRNLRRKAKGSVYLNEQRSHRQQNVLCEVVTSPMFPISHLSIPREDAWKWIQTPSSY